LNQRLQINYDVGMLVKVQKNVMSPMELHIMNEDIGHASNKNVPTIIVGTLTLCSQ
jgi:hypothetical protein